MTTIRELIELKKCRRGKATGTTKRGAYWLACEPIKIRDYGGDGIGNNAADMDHKLELRYYRDGTIAAVIRYNAWHQNYSPNDVFTRLDAVLGCETVEDVIVVLKGATVKTRSWDDGSGGDETHAYSDRCEERLTEALTALGVSAAATSPDDQE
jgi:hypothetical protein